MTTTVRELAPEGRGVPVEIYAFSKDTSWVAYEHLQADIYDRVATTLETRRQAPVVSRFTLKERTMRNEEIMAELTALRAEVLALAEARKEVESQAAAEPQAVEQVAEDVESSPEHEGFMGQVHELVELLEEELKETPVLSGIVIFSLGVLVGRLLR